jgi:hypothetical protein
MMVLGGGDAGGRDDREKVTQNSGRQLTEVTELSRSWCNP